MHEDCMGHPIQVGDIHTHASHHGSSSIQFAVGVVRELRDDGTFAWDKVSECNEWSLVRRH
jgi:hypothetical protein